MDTFGMGVAAFSVTNKANRIKFFEKSFLMANVSLEVVFGMLFFTLSGANVDFLGRELRWRIYTTKKAFLTTRRVELVDKKEFAAAALDPESETFVVYIASLSSDTLSNSSLLHVHLSYRLQISGLIAKKAFTKVPVEYLDFADVFSPDLASKLPKHQNQQSRHRIGRWSAATL